MRSIQIIFLSTALVSSAVSAGGWQQAPGANSVAQTAPTPLNKVRHQQSHKEAEVKRLERNVTKQQSESEQASMRLQRQDQAIADLQKQLQDLKKHAPIDKQ